MAKELWFVSSASDIKENKVGKLREEVLDELSQWNGEMGRYSLEPLVFWTWVRALQRRILQDEFPSATAVWTRPNPDFLSAVLSDRRGSAIWCDIRPSARIETCQIRLVQLWMMPLPSLLTGTEAILQSGSGARNTH